MTPDSPREGEVANTSDSKSTESDNDDPYAARVPVDRRPQHVSFGSRRVKMYRGDVDYNSDKDLDQAVTKPKKQMFSRPKFVTKPSSVFVQEGVDLLNTIFSQATTTTTLVQDSVSTPSGTIITSNHVYS
ncbi:hypothetical protein L1987_40412 [Smallanthus sonchifolius]|uniref:Uncharacterized protein n=1 Tax=Smallanthus sonchifolius TaxID=185202 RepID=A0ACB9GT21_9ASTR|nr:hypothetical protein L1987_40412 [Smallanthus sonchifolius]